MPARNFEHDVKTNRPCNVRFEHKKAKKKEYQKRKQRKLEEDAARYAALEALHNLQAASGD